MRSYIPSAENSNNGMSLAGSHYLMRFCFSAMGKKEIRAVQESERNRSF
jgi:hypothetical protein